MNGWMAGVTDRNDDWLQSSAGAKSSVAEYVRCKGVQGGARGGQKNTSICWEAMDEWFEELMVGWKFGWMNEWIKGGMNEWLNKRMNGWINERMNGYINVWMNEWIDEWMDEWIYQWTKINLLIMQSKQNHDHLMNN